MHCFDRVSSYTTITCVIGFAALKLAEVFQTPRSEETQCLGGFVNPSTEMTGVPSAWGGAEKLERQNHENQRQYAVYADGAPHIRLRNQLDSPRNFGVIRLT